MGISLELVDFNSMIKNLSKPPLVVNDFNDGSEEDKEKFNSTIYTKYSTDLLNNLPTCECGEYVGEYNVGVTCPNCNTVVESKLDKELEPIVWIRSPKGVAPLMNPKVWTMLSEKFTRSGFDIIRWITDTSYRPQVRMPNVMVSIQELGIERGYNNFVNNFDYIMDTLFSLKGLKTKKPGEDQLYILLKENRNIIFSEYLPLPNKALLVIEETDLGTFIDPIMTGAIDAIRIMTGIDSELCYYSVKVKEHRTVKTIAQLSEFYDGIDRTMLAKKEGLPRKHIFGTRAHFSFRAVISLLSAAHEYDELHIPWGVGVSVFSIHLMNKLLRRGYTPNDATAFLNKHANTFHPLINELFKLLIDESPYKKISVIHQRNPSLEKASY